jgi:hypothetical protein
MTKVSRFISLTAMLIVFSCGAAFGATVSLNKPATASSVENAGVAAGYAVDGIESSRWASDWSDPQWLQVDLEDTYAVNVVKIFWEYASASDYKIQIADSPTGPWTDCASVTGNTLNGRWETLEFAPQTGRYIRVYCTARTTEWGYSIFELEVYQNCRSADISIGEGLVVPDTQPNGVPMYPWFPDGHLTVIPDGDSYQMYWPGWNSYKTVGTDPMNMSDPGGAVLSAGASGSYDNGGAWLMSVFRESGNNMIGFFHAEDHEFPPHENPSNYAYKSMALCTSSDNGDSWTKQGQIITNSVPKPSTPAWSGSGDFCVVYDATNSRWVCYYQNYSLYMAVSYDPDAAPGTWYKYYNGDFTEPGLGGEKSPIEGLSAYPGANPSVHYNTYLAKWVMVWHTWDDTGIWLSTSDDMINWNQPINIVLAEGVERAWYPTIVGDSDTQAGQTAWLYYAYWPDRNNWQRQFLQRKIVFNQADIDGSRFVDLGDYSVLANHWLGSDPSSDIVPTDGDGIVDFDDLLMICNNWLVESDLHPENCSN